MHIMDFFRKTKGSMSIFLCLVLLPMVTYSTMIVDASRLQASKTAIAGAGDLALNSVMAEYDPDLKKLYGIFAVYGKDENKLQNELNKYFTATLMNSIPDSSKENEDYINDFFNNIISGIFSGDYQSVDDIDFDNLLGFKKDSIQPSLNMASPVSDSAALERQINEYMKYRGPVSLGSNLLEKLNILKDSSKQTKVIEKKIEYTEKLQDVQEAFNDAWMKLNNYNDKDTEVKGFFETNKLEDTIKYETNRAKVVQMLIKKYQEIDARYDKSLINLNSDNCRNSYKMDNYNYIYNQYSTKQYDDDTKSNQDIMDMLAADLKTVINQLESYCDDSKGNYGIIFNPSASNYDTALPPPEETTEETTSENNEGEEEPEEEPFEVSVEKDNFSEMVEKNIKALKLENFPSSYSNSDVVTDEDVNNCRIAIDSFNSAIQDIYGVVYYADNYHLDEYAETMGWIDVYKDILYNKYIQYADAVYNDSSTSDNAKKKIEENKKYFTTIYNELNSRESRIYIMLENTKISKLKDTMPNQGIAKIRGNFDKYTTKLNDLKNLSSSSKNSLDNIKVKLKESEQSKENWNSSIGELEAGNTKTAMQDDFDTTTNQIKEEDINDFIAIMYDGRNDQISLGRYFIHNKDIENINSAAFFDIPVNELSLEKIIQNIDKEVWTANECPSSSSVLLDKTHYLWEQRNKDIEDKIIPFYDILKGIAAPVKSTLSDNQNEDIKKINEKIKTSGWEVKSENFNSLSDDDKAKLNASTTNSDNNGVSDQVNVSTDNDDNKKKESSDKSKKALGEASSFLDGIKNVFNKLAETALLEEYTTEMFTCYTDGKEGQFTTLSGNIACKENKEKFEENEYFAPYYGAEIEYLLWGGNNPQDSITRNCAMIYLIRFALNAVFAFTSPEITGFALEVATAIAGWTVVGVPIVQAIIIIAIAMGESALDIADLLKGEDVPIYKSAATWKLSISGLVEKLATTVVENVSEKVVDCSEKKINEVVGNVKTVTEDVDKQIDAYIYKVTESKVTEIAEIVKNTITTPIINTITSYVTSDGTVVEVSDGINDAMQNTYDNIQANIDSLPELVKGLAQEAFDSFKSEYPAVNFKDKVSEFSTDVNNKINGFIDGITKKINTKINQIIENSYFNKVKDELKNEIGNLADKTGDEAKKAIKEGVDKVSSNITKGIDSALPDDKVIIDKKDLSEGKSFTLNYKEYCKIFMCINLNVDKNNVLGRTSSLIGLNVSKKKGDFDMSKAYTMFQINADVEMPTIFNWNIAVNTEDNSLSFNNSSDNAIKIKYNAANGY